MATRQEVIGILLDLAKKYPYAKFSADNARAYAASLSDIDARLLKAAALQCASSGDDFFPSIPDIRKAAMDLQMIAIGVPTPSEAWAQVQQGEKYFEPVYCDIGLKLRQACETGDDYMIAVYRYAEHERTCETCKPGGFREHYDHPAVAATVRRLGGREALLTDNSSADRARFIEAYREIVAREKMIAGMPVEVKEFITEEQLYLEDRRAAWQEERDRAFDMLEPEEKLLTSLASKLER